MAPREFLHGFGELARFDFRRLEVSFPLVQREFQFLDFRLQVGERGLHARLFGAAAFPFREEGVGIALELVLATAVGFRLAVVRTDFGLSRDDDAFGVVDGLAGCAESLFDADAFFAGGGGDAEVFLDLFALAHDVFADAGEGGIGAAQFLFLVAEAFAVRGNVVLVALDEAREFAFAFAVEADAAFRTLDAADLFVQLVAEASEEGFHFAQFCAFRGDVRLLVADAVFRFRLACAEALHRRFQFGVLGGQFPVLAVVQVGIEHEDIPVQFLPAAGLRGLPLRGSHLALQLGEDVIDAQEVGFRVLQLAEGLALLCLALGDPGGFLEDLAAVLRFGAQEHVDLPLFHDAVGTAAHARVHEQLVDVLETAGVAIQFVLALPVPEHPARDADLVEIHPEILLAVVEDQADLRHAERLALVRAIEDDVRHFPAAERLRRCFPEGPADPVDHIGFPAAVRSDDGGDAFMEVDFGFVGEGFEAVEFEAFEAHT